MKAGKTEISNTENRSIIFRHTWACTGTKRATDGPGYTYASAVKMQGSKY